MNPDKLKQFVRDHREEFDGEFPPAGLWDRIEKDLGDEPSEEAADPLAEFIAKHRDAFDEATPPPELTEKLFPAADTPVRTLRPRRRLLGILMGIAAALLLLLVAYHSGNRAGYRAGQEERVAAQLERVDPGLAEAERFYRQRIDSEFTKVSQVNDDPQLRRDLAQIDAATAQLREELLTVPVSQRPVLVNQLIATYRTKLDILLRIQQHFPNPKPSGTATDPANIPNHES